MKITYIIESEFEGMALRDVLAKKYMMSNLMIKKIKLYGELDVNGVHTRVIDKIHVGDRLDIAYGEDSIKINQNSEIKIYYEDEWLLVCEKPAGVVTHPTHGHLDDSLITLLTSETLHPVMRLDRETSGLIVLAKNGYAHNTITISGIDKKYIAVVYKEYEPKQGIINKAIKRREGSIMIRDVCPDNEGHPSITHYNSLYYDKQKDISLVGFKLETGRCHQIRVHSTYMGHPLIGDGLYGPNSIDNPNTSFKDSLKLDQSIGRQALHAAHLSFVHPFSREKMCFESNIPDDMLSLFDNLSRVTCDELTGEFNRL